MSDEIHVQVESLRHFIYSAFSAVKVPESDARWLADAFVQTHLWGVDTHGVVRLNNYVTRLRDGLHNPTPQIRPLRQLPALEVLDGDNGNGLVVARTAMDRAVELAATTGIAMVGAIKSNHFGAAGLYAMRAARRGMIGIAMSNVLPLMALPGGKEAVVGNNPLALAVPMAGGNAFLLDTAMSIISWGRLQQAIKKAERIPLDWTLDKEGQPTADPAAASSLQPIAGYKGIGLAYAVEILTGVINGGSFLSQLWRRSASFISTGISHTMIAINTDALLGNDTLADRMDTFSGIVKSSSMLDPAQEITLPGERKWRTQQHRLQTGIPLPAALYDELLAMAQSLGLEITLATNHDRQP